MKDIDKAKALGRRAFYERYTDSIRLCPENYCLATRINGKWKVYNDGQVKDKWNNIQKTLDIWQGGSTGDALADEVGRLFR